MANSKRSKAMKQAWQRRKAGLTKNESDVAAAVSETAPKKPLWERQIDAKEAAVQKVVGKALIEGQVLPDIVRHLVDVKQSLNEVRSMVATPPNSALAHAVEVSKRLDGVVRSININVDRTAEQFIKLDQDVKEVRRAVNPERLEDVETQLTELDERIADLEEQYENLSQRLTALESKRK